MAYLEVNNIEKKYSNFNLSATLSVEKGELICILGPSGSGKSTLLSLISGMEKIDSGKILLNDKDITNETIEKKHIGFVFQDYALFSSMNVSKNVQFGMKKMPRDEKKKLTANLLKLVGLSGYEKRKVDSLSGGEAQRVALVRALAAEPDVLLLDEPLSSLDSPLRKKLRGLIRAIHDSSGMTMLYVTHDREEAFACADRIVIIKDGKIDSIGRAEELYRHPKTLFSAFFTGDGTALDSSLFFDEGEESGKKVFFRPESVIVSEEPLNTGLYPNHLILNECCVESVEFKGEGYMILLSFCNQPIIAFSPLKPKKKVVSLMMMRDSLIYL